MRNYQDQITDFKVWLSTPLGQKIISLESNLTNKLAGGMRGYDAIILGHEPFLGCIDTCPIKNKYIISNLGKTSTTTAPTVVARQERLPIESDVIDLVYLAHCLEFSPNPEEILIESHRVLRADGRIIITIFNPWGLWGAWRLLAKLGGSAPWNANFIALGQTKDWLAGLGFAIMRVNHLGFCLPCCAGAPANRLTGFERWAQKLGLAGGAVYVLEANKITVPLTPVKPVWSTAKDVVVDDAVEPTV